MNKIQNFAQIIRLIAVSCCFFFGSCTEGELSEKDKAPIEYVDPFMEKQSLAWENSIRELKESVPAPEIPLLGLPFGQTHWTFQNSPDYKDCLGDFSYPMDSILSIRPTHWNLKRCFADYGTFKLRLGNQSKDKSFPFRAQALNKDFGGPVSFQGNLPELNSTLEFAISSRSALFQLISLKKDTLVLGISPHTSSSYTKINFYPASGEIWVQDSMPALFPGLNMYYLIQTNNIYTGYGIWQARLKEPKETQLISTNPDAGFYIEFPLDSSESLQFKIAGSYWDLQDARLHLKKEIPDWDIAGVKERGRASWEELLGRISIEQKDQIPPQEIQNFYQSLFWASLVPRTFSGTDGLYPSFSGERIPERRESGNFYGDLSMWENGNSPQEKFLHLLFPENKEDIHFSKEHDAIRPSSDLDSSGFGGGNMNLAEKASLEVLRYLGLKALDTDVEYLGLQKPVFTSWVLNKAKPNEFQFSCDCPADGSAGVRSATFNGKKLDSLKIKISDILQGGKLEVFCE